MRVASGALVCGLSDAWGSHGVCGCSEGCLDVALFDSFSTSRACFSARLRAVTRLSVECFSGLRVRRISVSLSRTSRLSVRRSLSSAAVPMALDLVFRCDVLADSRRSSPSPVPVPDATRGRAVDV